MKKLLGYTFLALSGFLALGSQARAESSECQVSTESNQAIGRILNINGQFYFIPSSDTSFQQLVSSQDNVRYLNKKANHQEVVVKTESKIPTRYSPEAKLTVTAKVKATSYVDALSSRPFLKLQITGNAATLQHIANALNPDSKSDTLIANRDQMLGALLCMQEGMTNRPSTAIATP